MVSSGRYLFARFISLALLTPELPAIILEIDKFVDTFRSPPTEIDNTYNKFFELILNLKAIEAQYRNSGHVHF